MSLSLSPRLPESVKEAVRLHIAGQSAIAPVQISRILHDIRSKVDVPHISDEDLVRQIVMDATDHGLSVHFDRTESPEAGS